MSKAKKKLASSFASLKAGRAIITKMLGNDGETLISSLKDATKTYKNKSEATTLKKNIYKLAIKAKIMTDSNKLDIKLFEDNQKLIHDCSTACLKVLKNSEKNNEDIKNLLSISKDVLKLLHLMMDKNMKEKNINLLEITFITVFNENFLTFLSTDKKVKEYKDKLYNSLHTIKMLADENYALDVNCSLPKDKFNSQYKKEIEVCQTFWKEAIHKREHIGMSLFSRLVEKHSEYYNILENCIDGEDAIKQHGRLVDCLDYIIIHMDQWPELKVTLEKVGKNHNEWMPNVKIEVYEHLMEAFHLGMSKIFSKYLEEKQIRESYNIMLRLVQHILKSVY